MSRRTIRGPRQAVVVEDLGGVALESLAEVFALADTPTVYNVTMTLADTEYSQALPSGTTGFMIQCRQDREIQLAFVSGESDTVYITIPKTGLYYKEDLDVDDLTLYFQSSVANKVAEIVAWG
ncbi:hypothetical protein GF373_17635 [bacterium]|nr:hypothetical protein [bacterium]